MSPVFYPGRIGPLTVPNRIIRAGTSESAWTLGLGFALSALRPVLVGLLRDLSGGFALSLSVLGGCALACGMVGQLVHPGYGRDLPVSGIGSTHYDRA